MFYLLLFVITGFFTLDGQASEGPAAKGPAFLVQPWCAEAVVQASGSNFIIPYQESVSLVQAPRNYGHVASPPRLPGQRTAKNGRAIRPYVVAYRGKMFRQFSLDKSEHWPSPCLVRVEGKVPANSRRMVVALHGMGSTYSHLGAWLPFLNEIEDRLPGTAVEAVDLPRHGFLKSSGWEPSLDQLVKQLIAELDSIRAQSKIPVTLLGRSASAGVALEVARLRPDLVDKLVLIAPTPSKRPLLEEIEVKLNQMVAKKLLELDPVSFPYAYGLMRQMDFHNWDWSSWKVPTDIYSSIDDPEGAVSIREYWKGVGAQSAAIRVFEFPGKRHDPFTADEPMVREEVWGKFLERYLR